MNVRIYTDFQNVWIVQIFCVYGIYGFMYDLKIIQTFRDSVYFICIKFV